MTPRYRTKETISKVCRTTGATFDVLKAASRSLVGSKAFSFKVHIGPPIVPVPGESDYVQLTERIRQAVLQLAG